MLAVSSRPPGPLVTGICLGVLCLIWGSTWVVIQGGLEDLPPFTSAGLRFAVAALIMVAVARPLHRVEGGAPPSFDLTVVMGLLNFAASYGIVYWTETILPSGLVCVLWAVFPMMVAFASHYALPGERLGFGAWIGFVLGFVGVAVLFATDVTDVGPGALTAALILLASPAVCTIGNVWVKRRGARVSSVLLNRNGMVLGAIALLALARATEAGIDLRWTPFAVFSLLYLSIAGTVLTFGLYFWLLRTTPAHRMSLIAYVTPVVALLLGAVFRREEIGFNTLLGTGFVLAGVYLVMRRSRGRGVDRAVGAAPDPRR